MDRNPVTGEGYEGVQYEVLSTRTGKVGKMYKTEATGN